MNMDSELQNAIDELPQSDDKTDSRIMEFREKDKRSHMAWSKKEDEIIINLQKNHLSDKEISELLGRRVGAITSRIKKLENEVNQEGNFIKKTNPQKESQPIPLDEHNPKKISNESELNFSHNNINSEPYSISQAQVEKNKKAIEYRKIAYWRSSLLDSEIVNFSDKAKKETAIPIDWRRSKEAHRLSDDETNILFKIADSKAPKNKKSEVKEVEILISLLVIRKKTAHVQTYDSDINSISITALWIPAKVDREGNLSISKSGMIPWIDRRLLDPKSDDHKGYPSIGSLEELDSFYTHNQNSIQREDSDWENVLKYLKKLRSSLYKDWEQRLDFSNYELETNNTIAYVSSAETMIKGIISVYEQIQSSKEKFPPLLKKILTESKTTIKSDRISDNEQFILSKNHVAQMTNDYPLAKSQREALTHLQTLDQNFVFTVNGPPGTGKTTLILSIIAKEWVQSAIDKTMPKLLVLSSTNNAAVVNVLQKLREIIKPNNENILLDRWLPDMSYLGCMLTSQSNVKNKGLHNELYEDNNCNQVSGTLDKFYGEEYRGDATDYFLSKFNQYYDKKESSLDKCIDSLHQSIISEKSIINNIIDGFDLEKNTKKDIEDKFGSLEALQQNLEDSQNTVTELIEALNSLENIFSQWQDFKEINLKKNNALLFNLFGGKKKVANAILEFIEHHQLSNDYKLYKTSQAFETYLSQKIKDSKELIDKQNIVLAEYHAIESSFSIIKQKNKDNQKLAFGECLKNATQKDIQEKLDTTIRYKIFLLSMHYWEANWLKESEKISSSDTKKHQLNLSKKDRTKLWQIKSMLTPCMITTLHSGANYFKYRPISNWDYLLDFIDLLIIDEGGQVSPSIAGAMIGLSKSLIVVGDDKQIEPVFSLPECIDLSNAKNNALYQGEEDIELLKAENILNSQDSITQQANSNLIGLTQQTNDYFFKNASQPGVLLTEHRRCADEIIEYCNQLSYDGVLEPMAGSPDCFLPKIGYAHIEGTQKKKNGSQANSDEALTIVKWIVKNKDKILKDTGEATLNGSIGIITPFKSQTKELKSYLKDHGLDIEKVGTVHSLQGAEKPIVIFSPVYSYETQKDNYFFDKSNNMMNVAISRAKKSFLVFGDMNIFDQSISSRSKPSGLLAKFLFAKPENEVTDIDPITIKELDGNEKIEQIISLEGHRKCLKDAILAAKKSAVIVSPFITYSAIKADDILRLIKSRADKTEITIYTDNMMNKSRVEEFQKCIEYLEEAGATVILVKRMHSKIIAIDDSIYINGSFNWLSASRDENYANQETSIKYELGKANHFIQEVIENIGSRIAV